MADPFLDNNGRGIDSPNVYFDDLDFLTKTGLAGANAQPNVTETGGSGVTSVTAADTTITVGGTSSAPTLKATVGTAAGTVAAGNDARLVNAVQSVTAADTTVTVGGTATTPTVKVNVGTAAGTVAAGDDSRITGALQSGATAGGDLSGTLPNPTVAKVNGLAVGASPGGTTDFLRADGTWAAPPSGGGGAVIDTTATDITKLGTQGAGSTGKAADAGHVHPAATANNTLDDGSGNMSVAGRVSAVATPDALTNMSAHSSSFVDNDDHSWGGAGNGVWVFTNGWGGGQGFQWYSGTTQGIVFSVDGYGVIGFGGDTTKMTSTTATAGNAGAALPAQPEGFLVATINGANVKIPYYLA